MKYSDWNTDWADQQAVEDVVKRFPRSEQEFALLFFDTQMFTIYTEKLLDIAFKVKMDQNQKLLAQVEEKIMREEGTQRRCLNATSLTDSYHIDISTKGSCVLCIANVHKRSQYSQGQAEEFESRRRNPTRTGGNN